MQGNDVEMAPEEEYSAAGLFSTTDEHTVVLVGQFPGRAIAASVLQPGSAGPSAGGCGVLKSRWEDGWSLRSWVCGDRKVQVQVSGLVLPVWPRSLQGGLGTINCGLALASVGNCFGGFACTGWVAGWAATWKLVLGKLLLTCQSCCVQS